MGKPSPEKSNKRRKRQQKKDAKEKLYRQRTEPARSFPEVVYQGNGPESLMDLVIVAMRSVVLEHEKLLSPAMAASFQRARKVGFPVVNSEIRIASERASGCASAPGEVPRPVLEFNLVLGHLLFARLPEDFWSRVFRLRMCELC